MIVLSLFDGMSCGQIALERAGIKVDKYYASEIDKYAMQITQKNYPNTIQLGDITKWQEWDIEKPDLIIGGSPCQGFSFAGKRLNFEDPRSKLFFVFKDILDHHCPDKFLMENVKMKKEYQDIITDNLYGMFPMEINSSLVSAQNRKRLYWFNWNVGQPTNKGIIPETILEKPGFCASTHRFHSHDKGYRTVKTKEKFPCLNASYGKGWPNTDSRPGVLIDLKYNKVRTSTITRNEFRKLTPIECERLQTVPDNYTEGVSDTQRYKMLGNGWTVDVIVHILKYFKKNQ